jgi:hypothetical protein
MNTKLLSTAIFSLIIISLLISSCGLAKPPSSIGIWQLEVKAVSSSSGFVIWNAAHTTYLSPGKGKFVSVFANLDNISSTDQDCFFGYAAQAIINNKNITIPNVILTTTDGKRYSVEDIYDIKDSSQSNVAVFDDKAEIRTCSPGEPGKVWFFFIVPKDSTAKTFQYNDLPPIEVTEQKI